jgi:hypothetical protein
MLRTPLAIPLTLAAGLLCLANPAYAQPSGWSEHRNEKYGFSLKYPGEVFKLERTSEAGDGHVFVTQDGHARLLVGALVNGSGFTPVGYQDHVARQSYSKFKVTYRPVGRSWFVLSGEGDGKIFYEKVIFSCSGRLINSFAMIYPKERRDVFDPLVEQIEDSFHAGATCERALSPAVKRESPATDLGGKRSRQRGSRSHKHVESQPQLDRGNWIVRGRAGPGHVILQQTSPPYGRKVVPGQAF